MTVLAWAGELLLLEARWTDKDAHTAKFRLVSPNESRPNPFKQFTKRRSGKAGTRFVMSLASIDEVTTDKTAYDGEVMLAGWADTSTQGYTVTFWMEAPEEGVHHLDGYQRGVSNFMCALAELDDDDSVIDQEKRKRVEEYKPGWDDPREQAVITPEMLGVDPDPPKPKGPRKLSQYAAMLCQNKDFWAFVNEETDISTLVQDTEAAAHWMRYTLQIASRRELDDEGLIAEAYHDKIRKPFVAWSEEREHS